MTNGVIFNIQRFSLHDGPGIRTTAFLKGCPLRCRWCHNPEGIPIEPAKTDRLMSAEEVTAELARDRIFYEESGGGITLSGGEPLAQPDFAIETLRLCKDTGLHTAIDTCGFVEPEVLQAAAPFADLFLYDIKHPDSTKHNTFTDVPNDPIIENLKTLCAGGNSVLVRCPIIPGVNDDPETIKKTGELLESCGADRVQLLPYHPLGTSKTNTLSGDIPFMDFTPPSSEQMLEIQRVLGNFAFVTISGEQT